PPNWMRPTSVATARIAPTTAPATTARRQDLRRRGGSCSSPPAVRGMVSPSPGASPRAGLPPGSRLSCRMLRWVRRRRCQTGRDDAKTAGLWLGQVAFSLDGKRPGWRGCVLAAAGALFPSSVPTMQPIARGVWLLSGFPRAGFNVYLVEDVL